ncbi:MAG: diacylglycerol kinase family protein [Patescibacteria group bacterium]|nr:diacylglycerol kinase family protein [Patescibacteria group bacterium]MDD4304662.1 diacylglycerol kinase family protein [Patescibacteria group bacterium]MDD4695697.1 diacylglycerol kinase family protein [Patescibacteria group bacterium]
MYIYIYDSCLKENKYRKLLDKIESRIIDLDIKGKILKLNILKNIKQFINEEIEKGAHTVVVVGNDSTLSSILENIIDQKITIAYIPIDKGSKFAQILGIPYGELACNILSGRIIKKLDIGKINKKYFLNSIIIENSDNIEMKIDSFTIKALPKNKIIIKNLSFDTNQELKQSNPTDGILEIFIENCGGFMKKNLKHSLFTTDRLLINSKGESTPLIIDNNQIINTPVEITIADDKLNIIVGSNRQF